MIDIAKNKSIKVIALALSILLLWQGVVWANPEIFKREHLQPRTMLFNPSDGKESFSLIMASYLTNFLKKYESDPENHNLYSMKTCVEKALEDLKTSEDIPEGMLERLPDLVGAPEAGAFACIRHHSEPSGPLTFV